MSDLQKLLVRPASIQELSLPEQTHLLVLTGAEVCQNGLACIYHNSMNCKLGTFKQVLDQHELMLEQFPSQIKREVAYMLEKQTTFSLHADRFIQSGLLQAGLHEGRTTTPAAIRETMAPADCQQSLAHYAFECLSSDEVQPHLPVELLFESAFCAAVTQLVGARSGQHTAPVSSGDERTAVQFAQSVQPLELKLLQQNVSDAMEITADNWQSFL